MGQTMKRKMIPPIIMLAAGAITSIITFKMHYELYDALIILLVALFAFYIMGCIIKKVLDTFEDAIEAEMLLSEGEVIEKQLEEEVAPEEEMGEDPAKE